MENGANNDSNNTVQCGQKCNDSKQRKLHGNGSNDMLCLTELVEQGDERG